MSVVNGHGVDYPTPVNISYMWGFGSVALVCLVIQIVSGVLLSMHYLAHVDYAFGSVEHIMRDVNNGWLIRYMHANGASFFFAVVYVHMGRGLYYGSYIEPRGLLWVSGVVIFLLMMGTGFIGYVLPWGQMSFWGATVITNLVSAVPMVGQNIAEWIWGGYSIDDPTLRRFYSLHFMLPFILVGLAFVHLVLLHRDGSNNPLGTGGEIDRIGFYPYYYVKDLLGVLVMVMMMLVFVVYVPNYLGHSDNYIRVDSLKTPAHIVPEWYFLPFYTILRTIEHKLGGVLAMVGAIVALMLLPYISTSEVRSSAFRPIYRKMFWVFAINVVLLGWLGAQEAVYPYTAAGKACAIVYFGWIMAVPLVGRLESMLMRAR